MHCFTPGCLRRFEVRVGSGEQSFREIVEGDSGQLRHTAGGDAVPFLQWRASMSDEQWVDWGAQDDGKWIEAVKRDFGMDLKL